MRETLGEFEQMVLLAILNLGEDVYGVPIVDEIARRTGREVAPAAVYVTLRRLEEKGMLAEGMGESARARASRVGAPPEKRATGCGAASTSICEGRDDAAGERAPVQSAAPRASDGR